MMLLCFPIALGWISIAIAPSVTFIFHPSYHPIVIGRFFTGFSGAFAMLAPAFVGKVADVEIRGVLSSAMQVMTMIGLVSTYIGGAYFNWRNLAYLCLLPPVLAIPSLYLLPESPSYLLSKGKEEEARKAVQFYCGSKGKIVEVEMDTLRSVSTQEEENTTDNLGIHDILSSRQYRKPLLISIMLMMLQQFSGIKVISSNLVEIFQRAGAELDANNCTIIVGSIQVFGSSVAGLIVDSFGRKNLLIYSESFICGSFAVLGLFFRLQEMGFHPPAWVPLVCLVIFALAYSVGLAPIPWLLNNEMFSREAKSTSSSYAAASNWLISYIVVLYTPSFEAAFGEGVTYLCYALVAAFGILLIVSFVPESKGKVEEEVEAL